MNPLTPLALAALLASGAGAQPAGSRTYANPIDIDYRYNFELLNQGISYRSGADPVVVVHGGAYYLFETIAGGYWRSTDLVAWTFVRPSRWPFMDIVAPAALSVRDTLYLMQSSYEPRPLLFSTDPASGRLAFYNRLMPWLPRAVPPGHEETTPADSLPPGPWDPDLFHDPEGDRWFLYWGSSNVFPVYGIALDKARRLAYVGEPRALLRLHPDVHGWERFGRDHRDSTIMPYVEGAWMVKHGGRYYLQYGAPGTEYNVYATGTYVGTDPLGPFTYAPYNPVAYRPGGFVVGAGHGSTFRDLHGNWWLTGTPWIGVNDRFERRIALFPARFDADGQFWASTRFGDLPHYVPTDSSADPRSTFTGWMLLSYRKPAVASSTRDSFPASNTTDEDYRTFWVAGANRPGETLTIDLGGPRTVRALQVNYADHESGLYENDSTVYTRFRLLHSPDGRRWELLADLSRETRDRPNAYVELPAPVRTRFIRYEHGHVGARNLAIADLRVFGTADGPPPATPRGLTVRRHADARDATVTWTAVPGAVGYNVLWGIAPDRLYQAYQRFADQGTTLELRALTVGQPYHVAIEAFDEHGVSRRSAAVRMP